MARADLNIIDAKAVIGEDLVSCCISVAGSRILRVGKEPKLPSADKKHAAHGKLVLPGLIDVHAHLRDFDESHKEDFYSGTCAAAHGGFTTVLAMPNTKPPIDRRSMLESAVQRASKSTVVNVGFYASPSSIHEAWRCAKTATGFKVNLLHPYSSLPNDDTTIAKMMDLGNRIHKPVCFHAEDQETVSANSDKAGEVKRYGDFLRVHSVEAECRAIRRLTRLAQEARAPLHVCHLSSAAGAEILAAARRSGLKVSVEVTPQHLFLSHRSIGRLAGAGITVPPVRGANDRRRLWAGLVKGEIDMVATDHAPHTMEEKAGKDLMKVAPGIAGLETALPLMLTHILETHAPFSLLTRTMAAAPAAVFNLKGKGNISKGGDADLVVVDTKARFKIDSSTFLGKCRLSPFEGTSVRGRVVLTLVSGQPVFDEEGIVAGAGTGAIIK